MCTLMCQANVNARNETHTSFVLEVKKIKKRYTYLGIRCLILSFPLSCCIVAFVLIFRREYRQQLQEALGTTGYHGEGFMKVCVGCIAHALDEL